MPQEPQAVVLQAGAAQGQHSKGVVLRAGRGTGPARPQGDAH